MRKSREEMVCDNLPLVYWVVSKFYPTYRRDEDLVQVGMLGLCKAADTWDEDRSKFSTYAIRVIRNEIRMELGSRKKRKGEVSLNQLVSSEEDGICLNDVLVGDQDVEYVDMDAFIARLSPVDQQYFRCVLQNYTKQEMMVEFNCSDQVVCKHLRRLKRIWNEVYKDER